LVPTDTNSIALSSLIGTPYNYWGDDDGDGQGIDGITATGSLKLSIVDKDNNPVARNEVLTSCNNNKAPYKLTLSNSEGRLTTRYGVPNESRFSAGNATYYIKPKAAPAICLVSPYNTSNDGGRFSFGLSAAVWQEDKGFLPQSVTPSSYGLNFPTTGANNLLFWLYIGGVSQALSWAPVSHGGITATMTGDRTGINGLHYVRVTLTGPAVTDPNQQKSDNPGRIGRPSLPQVFELVGRDSRGNAVVKYGFVLKQWFVSRDYYKTYSNTESWCNKIGGYRVPKVKDLTNASCKGEPGPEVPAYYCRGYESEINALTATPSSPDNTTRRHIGGGFLSEWGWMSDYSRDRGANFCLGCIYWTQDRVGSSFLLVGTLKGSISVQGDNQETSSGLCVYP
ncbi:hypothetical protein, partial [Gilliamella apis]|uniref:hypothetical protein n=1 Tax=Gilliamella apis TaxID=1970738 RepID=UPI000B635F13